MDPEDVGWESRKPATRDEEEIIAARIRCIVADLSSAMDEATRIGLRTEIFTEWAFVGARLRVRISREL